MQGVDFVGEKEFFMLANGELMMWLLPDGNMIEVEQKDGAGPEIIVRLFIDSSGVPAMEKTLREISEKESHFNKEVGPGEGISLAHCVYLGTKYEQNFLEKICGYRTFPPTKSGMKIKVMFYENVASRIQ